MWQNSKSQIVTKLKNSNRDNTQIVRKKIRNTKCDNLNCDKTWELELCPKLKLWQTVMKLKNFYCDKTQNLKWWQNSKTQIMTKLKLWEKKLKKLKCDNSNCDKTWELKWWQTSKLKFWQYSKTQIVSKAQIVMKLKLWWNSRTKKLKKKLKCEEKNSNSKCDKTQIVTKLESLNYDKTQYLDFEKTQKLKLWQNLKYEKFQFMKKTNFKIVF